MRVFERQILIKRPKMNENLIHYFEEELQKIITTKQKLLRFIITHADAQHYHCELSIIEGNNSSILNRIQSVFSFQRRAISSQTKFNAVLLIPTGIAAEIGGHSGDAGSIAKLIASVCDHLITHPNVVNGADINEMPTNTLYTEGSTLCRLMMGSIGLNPVRSNRVLFVLDENTDQSIERDSINSLNAARATYGLDCPQILKLSPALDLRLTTTNSGRASGEVCSLDTLFDYLEKHKDYYDSIALSTIIHHDQSLCREYFKSTGLMANPWGGVESLLTHAISMCYNIPSAHAPMEESYDNEKECRAIQDIVDPRMAAEFVSTTSLQCIFKGLHNSPQIITDRSVMLQPSVLTAKDIDCLIIPECSLGLPVLAALEQGIKVIAVKGNKNLMRNNLNELSWRKNQYYEVDNYLEAVGLLTAMKAGIAVDSVQRPINSTEISTYCLEKKV